MNEIEKAREVLRSNGYFVDNLWHIEDVIALCDNDEDTKYKKVTDEEAQRILNNALTNSATMEQIWYAISDQLED